MLRGEFIRGDGLVIPNNITTYGANLVFQLALLNTGYALHMGLANCNPDLELQLEDLNEPAIGTNGYARQAITRDGTGWPVASQLNGETYFETQSFVFTPSGGNFTNTVTRPCIVNHASSVIGPEVVALGTPLPDELTFTPALDVELRTFKYRIYGR